MIWCVEDDPAILDIELYALESTGFRVKGFNDGDSFLRALEAERPELVIMDVMLPGTDGITLLRQLKQNSLYAEIPVIMATAKGAEYDKIQSFNIGADDYLVKPFGVMEMVARVKAVLRRCRKYSGEILRAGSIEINTAQHTAAVNGEEVLLTLKEYELLRLLISRPGYAFTREQLFNSVWGEDFCGETRTLDMHIKTLRQKLGAAGEAIKTVRSVGYRLEEAK